MSTDLENITIRFPDGVVTLGGGDEFFVEPEDSEGTLMLDDERLALIARVQKAQEE